MIRHHQLPHLPHPSAQHATPTPSGPTEGEGSFGERGPWAHLQQPRLHGLLEFLTQSIASARPTAEATLSCLQAALARRAYHPQADPMTRLDWEAAQARGLNDALQLLGPVVAPAGTPGRRWHPRSSRGSSTSPESPAAPTGTAEPTPNPAATTTLTPGADFGAPGETSVASPASSTTTTATANPSTAPAPATTPDTAAAPSPTTETPTPTHPNLSTTTASEAPTSDPTHSNAADSDSSAPPGPSGSVVGGSGARAASLLAQRHSAEQAVLQSMQFQRRFLAHLWHRYANLHNVLRHARRPGQQTHHETEELLKQVCTLLPRGGGGGTAFRLGTKEGSRTAPEILLHVTACRDMN